MPRRPTDTYTVAEAAQVLGRSVKRVRQLIADGTLDVVPGSSPQRVPADQVRARRTAQRTAPPSGPVRARGMTPSEFQAVLQSLLTQQRELITAERAALEAELKAAHLRTEELLQAELDRERAARLQAEERLRELTEAQARRWWHRG